LTASLRLDPVVVATAITDELCVRSGGGEPFAMGVWDQPVLGAVDYEYGMGIGLQNLKVIERITNQKAGHKKAFRHCPQTRECGEQNE
jgi:hypothetical protein